jgi:hypothetical protein
MLFCQFMNWCVLNMYTLIHCVVVLLCMHSSCVPYVDICSVVHFVRWLFPTPVIHIGLWNCWEACATKLATINKRKLLILIQLFNSMPPEMVLYKSVFVLIFHINIGSYIISYRLRIKYLSYPSIIPIFGGDSFTQPAVLCACSSCPSSLKYMYCSRLLG